MITVKHMTRLAATDDNGVSVALHHDPKGDLVLYEDALAAVRRVWDETFKAYDEIERIRAELNHTLDEPTEADASVWRERLRMSERGLRRAAKERHDLLLQNRKLRRQLIETSDGPDLIGGPTTVVKELEVENRALRAQLKQRNVERVSLAKANAELAAMLPDPDDMTSVISLAFVGASWIGESHRPEAEAAIRRVEAALPKEDDTYE